MYIVLATLYKYLLYVFQTVNSDTRSETCNTALFETKYLTLSQVNI